MQFSANFGPNNSLAFPFGLAPLWEILDPPLQKPLGFYFAQREYISTSLFPFTLVAGEP